MSMIGDTSERAIAPLRKFEFGAPLNGMAMTAGGTVAVGLGDGSVRLVKPNLEALAVWPHEQASAVLTVVVDIDGGSVLTGGDDGRIAWTGEDGHTITLATFPGQQIDVLAVSVASGYRAVAAGREIHLFDKTSKKLASVSDHPSTVSGLAFSPDGKQLAVSHYGGATLWQVPMLSQDPRRLKWTGSHLSVSWSPDSSTVMTSMQENELHGWQLSDGANMRMKGYTNKVRSMDWLVKPMTLVTSGGECVIAWPFTDGGPMGKQPLERGPGLGPPVSCVAVHPSEPSVAVGFSDGCLSLYSFVDDKIIDLATSVQDYIATLSWSMDGQRLAVGTANGNVILFEFPCARC